ncbi:LysR family transcriptional regulator [Amycolatopsis sp. PS_44_ISF1]|uniref:LysR family transcriptional regulator n=1 Tax=Amycolatopsis sp. PS_44_ISF1 TaxID=2974917 RepID=UPI0028DF30AD|nr:LysR family transcriptional regulator [Amycolatopsis sp. PS_44_ISF1]MDT8912378.1 LysR family transcriptional regulator [Amycolatopsis sp. PS_44_ISF1]
MNNWTWDRLRVFDAVARTGSVVAAARSLRMTGPAVSQHLRRLEAEVGAVLVERAGRGLRLTGAGHVLAGHARTVARVVEHAERELAGRTGELHGTVRVGAVSSVIRGFLLPRVREFTENHPRVRVSLCDGETVDHLRALHEDALDVVLAESWHDLPSTLARGADITRLLTERARLVLPDGHRLAHRPTVPFSELTGEIWTSCPPGSDAHAALAQLVRRAGAELRVGFPVADHSTQLEVVANGLAVACVPELSLAAAPPGVRVVDTDPVPLRSIELVTQSEVLPLAVNEFVATLTGV